MGKKEVNIIPLGQSCLTRTILTRGGVKKRKIFGEKTYPFDFAVFGMPEVTKSLKTNFNEFFDDLEYVENGKNSYWKKAPDCIYFFHEKNCGSDDKDKLIIIYEKRIENFQNAVNSETPVLFVQIPGNFEDVENQYVELMKLRAGRPFKFAVIDTENIINKTFPSDVCVLKLAYPNDEYKNGWWKKSVYNSKEAKEFERKVCEFCKNVISTL